MAVSYFKQLYFFFYTGKNNLIRTRGSFLLKI